jgi:hypothetical protein
MQTALTGISACQVQWDRASNAFYLLNDQGNGWVAAASGVAANSQCAITASRSSVTGSGNTLTVNFALTFFTAFNGTKNVYILAYGGGFTTTSGWSPMGTWNVAAVSQAPVNVSVSPASGTGTAQTFAFAASSVNGYPYIGWMDMLFNYAVDGGGACYLHYTAASNTLSIVNDNGYGWLASAVVGSSGTIENSQCRLDAGASSVTRSFDTITVRPAITFKAGLPGLQNTYMITGDNAGLNSPWQQMGTWTTTQVSGPPTSLISVTPNAGAGLSQTFSYAVSNVNGASYMMQVHAIIGSAITDSGNCYVYYYRPGNYLGLLSDTGWAGGVQSGTPGSPGTLSNSQCQLNVGASSVIMSGNNLTMNLALTFNSAWSGARNNHLLVWDRTQIVGWQQMGTWTVITPQPPSNVSVSPTSGSGMAQTFSFTSSSPAGAGNVQWMEMEINDYNHPDHACFMGFWPGSQTVGLANDDGSGINYPWMMTGVLGSATPLQNSQCQVDLAHSSVVLSGNNVTVNVALTFLPAFAGARQTWLQTGDNAGLMAVWQQMGTWTVSVPTVPVRVDSSPSGLQLAVDGGSCTAPCNLNWGIGSNHTIGVTTSPQSGGTGTQYVYSGWSDLGAQTHSVTAPSSATTYTASFSTKYLLSTSAGTGGTISPASAWYSPGSPVSVSATVNVSGYQFSGFTGTTSSTSNPLAITMNGPYTLTANFSLVPAAVSVSPSSGAGASQIFTATYIDPVAYGQITEALLLVSSTGGTASACYVKWTPGNHFYLRNDSDSAWVDGTSTSVQNTQCRLDAPADGSQGSGQTLTVNFGLTFLTPFVGAKSAFLTTTTALGTAAWQQVGGWTVDMTSGDYTVTARTPTASTKQSGSVQYQYDVRAIGPIDGSRVRVKLSGVSIPSTPPCLASWSQIGAWDPAARTGTVTLAIEVTAACGGGYSFTYTPQVIWESGGGSGVSKTTTDTTLTCCSQTPTISITVTPTGTSLRSGQSAGFTATVRGGSSGQVSWDAPSVGTLSQGGLYATYSAPASIATTQYVVITARSLDDATKTASATVTLQPPVPTNLPSYTISGQVVQPDNSGFGPISILVTGDQAQTVPTDANGNYSIKLPAGHYVVKPSAGYGAVGKNTYDLLSDQTGQRNILKPFAGNVASDPPDDSVGYVRGMVHVPANGQPTPRDFWWTDFGINSADIQPPGCWVKPYNGSAQYANRDQSIGVSVTADASGPHFVITFTAPTNATLAFRDVVCRLRRRGCRRRPDNFH